MTARILDGRPIAEATGRCPSLVAVLIGDDEASTVYVRAKARAAERCGIDVQVRRLAAAAGTGAALATVEGLASEPAVDAVLVELPLPTGMDAARIQAAIDPLRDADGVAPRNVNGWLLGLDGPRPATAQAVMTMLLAAGCEPAGRRAAVVGRSAWVGKPAALLLLEANATVTIAHSRTRNLPDVTREAEILVAATGVPGLIRAEHIRPGAVVIDVGTTVVGQGPSERIAGDVDVAGALEVASVLTRVPGGVGPVTTAILLRTVVQLAEDRRRAPADTE
jgi:methylenetetrahydrofolate dehydrogenase (NADP+)/methenyltetrahydrofolate cyclohydrolase